MALDIAPAPPPAAPTSPPGAPALPVDTHGPFAALLAKRVQTASAPTTGGPSAADSSADPATPDRKTGTDPKDNTDALLLLQALPDTPPPALTPPVLPVGLAPPAPDTATTDKTKEVMDTRPILPSALSGATDTKTGGELLPQTVQLNNLATAAQAAAPAGVTAQTRPVGGGGQKTLLIGAKPANNTGIAPLSLLDTATDARAVVQEKLARLLEIGDKKKSPGDAPGPDGAIVAPPVPDAAPAANVLAALPPLPAESRVALASQAADAMQTVRVQAGTNGHGQMTVQLHPQDWGKLEVSVTMTPTGGTDGGTTVTAHLIAESHAVQTALQDHAIDLKRALTDAGLTLEHLSVSVRSVEASGKAQQANADPQGNQPRSGEAWTPSGTTTAGGGGGSAAFSGFGAGQGFYAPPATHWTDTFDEGDGAANVGGAVAFTANGGARGIDVRA